MTNSQIREGTHPLLPLVVEYQSTTGTHNGFALEGVYNTWDDTVSDAPGSDDMAWTCEPDDAPDEDEVAMTVTMYDHLMRKVRAYDHLTTYCVHIAQCACE